MCIKTVKILSIIWYTISSFAAFSQQRPQYTQYALNNYLLNPALSGIENYTDVRVGHRQQWTGLADAPATTFITAHFALGNQHLWPTPTSVSEKGRNPMSRNLMQHYSASPRHHGVGIAVVHDRVAKLTTSTLNLSYAYHLPVSQKFNLSFGVAGGLSRIGIDVNALQMEDPNDPAIRNTIIAQYQPELSAGAWFYGADFFAGISAQQLLKQQLAFTTNEQYDQGTQVPHFFLTGGYRISLMEDWTILPSILLKKTGNTPVSLDVNLKMTWMNRFWIGGGYRKNDAVALMAGANLSHAFNLSYSYDTTVSNLRPVNSGGHELMLGIMLNNVYKVICPQRMW